MKNNPEPLHWLSVIQLGLSLLGSLGLLSLASLLGMLSLFPSMAPGGRPLDTALLMNATGAAWVGLLLLPSAGYAFLRLMGRRKTPVSIDTRGRSVLSRPALWIFLLPILLAVGIWAWRTPFLTWLLLPPIHILTISVPVAWLAFLALRDISIGSPQRIWGVFGSSISLSPLIIFIVEMVIFVAGMMLVVVWISLQPELSMKLQTLGEHLMQSSMSPETVRRLLTPYLHRPVVVTTMFIFMAVIVPMVEELLKPLAIWFLAGKSLSLAQGFALGALCGAGYALVESLALVSQIDNWAILVLARIGTSVIHILTAGLSGLGLAAAWKYRRFSTFVVACLGAVALHALWNSLTLANALHPFWTNVTDLGLVRLRTVGSIAPYGLGALSVGGLFALLAINRKLIAVKAKENFDGVDQLPV